MMLISGANTGAVQPLATDEKVLRASKVQKPEEEAEGRQLKPVMDEYIRSEPQEPSGRYWMGKDEDGQPKIYFDNPEQAAGAPDIRRPVAEAPEAKEPEDKGVGPEKKERAEGLCACNTDKVDREIENLKKKQQELAQRLNTETDETKIKDLERQLAQVEQELRQKDNDTYRKQHSTSTVCQ